jgi:hypothetical protein
MRLGMAGTLGLIFSLTTGLLGSLQTGGELWRKAGWGRVQGEVIESRVEEVKDRGFLAVVRYRFRVDPSSYENTQYFPEGSPRFTLRPDDSYEMTQDWTKDHPVFPSREEAEAVVAAQRSGSTVEVRYDPKDPRLSALRLPVTWSSAGMSAGGLGLAVALLAWGRRKARQWRNT